MNEDDWGLAEQNADKRLEKHYGRLREHYKGLPLDDFMEWLEILKEENE
jgi:hypothetical protein